MRSICSTSLDASMWPEAARLLVAEFNADLFLSGEGYPKEETSWACIASCEEFMVTPDTTPEDISRFAFSPGGPAFGFFSYNYGMILRGVPSEKITRFPLGHLKKYAVLARFSSREKAVEVFAAEEQEARDVVRLLRRFAAEPVHTTLRIPAPVKCLPTPSMSREEYMKGVKKTLEYIRDGYTYQLNLSIRFSLDMSPADLENRFFHLFSSRPAPFYAWFTSGKNTIASTSPELFLRVKNGKVLSKPIKGTLAFDDYRPGMKTKLTSSEKESAELSMIVDLIRNDISYHCEYGSVLVKNHKSVFKVSNLLQMYAEVHGRLMEDSTCLDLFFDAFPGGSITGCPKLSSMRIIEDLEPHSRDIYCGSFVIIHDEKNMDSSIAIRTGYHDRASDTFDFFAGSGIVIDSIPEKEYLETMAKTDNFSIFFLR